jgi:hypothetical protein
VSADANSSGSKRRVERPKSAFGSQEGPPTQRWMHSPPSLPIAGATLLEPPRERAIGEALVGRRLPEFDPKIRRTRQPTRNHSGLRDFEPGSWFKHRFLNTKNQNLAVNHFYFDA